MNRKIITVLIFVFSISLLSATPLAYNNPNLFFESAKLKNVVIHILKILSTKAGSAPVIEFLFGEEEKWTAYSSIKYEDELWGKPNCTYVYTEPFVPGTHVALGNYNHIYDVSYYKCEGAHPCKLPMYESGAEKEKMKRFIFFKFKAIAAKGIHLFEKHLDNFMVALDINTKLLFSYGAPQDYEFVIAGNYVPLKWLSYEVHPNTKDDFLKFYQYDPIGYVVEKYSVEIENIKTNVVFYDWWKKAMRAGSSYRTVKEKRFMPRLSSTACTNWMVRNQDIPIVSPYKEGLEL